MPRGTKNITENGQARATAAVKPVVFLAPWRCIAGDVGVLGRINQGPTEFRCGCPACKPEWWCTATGPEGTRCQRTADLKRGDPNRPLCTWHIQEERRARERAEARAR